VSLRDQIIEAQDRPSRKPKEVPVPEWGFSIWLRVLTIADQVALAEGKRAEQMPVEVLLATVVDEDGAPVFTEDDRELLSNEEAPLIIRLFGEAAKLNGLSSKELEAAMEAFAKARDEQPSSDSPSLSGAPSMNSKPSPVPS
jgi:hypothetical protein